MDASVRQSPSPKAVINAAAESPPALSNGGTNQAVNLPLLGVASNDEHARRPSVQFLPLREGPGGTFRPPSRKGQRRISSPPPPPSFEPRVSFDTFDPRDSNAAADIFSYTLVRKHKDYEYTKRSRTFLCGLDTNEYSDHALEWLIDELVDDGDEIVCLRVIEKDSKIAGDASVEDGKYRDKAEALMKEIQSKNTENKAINLILEFSVGKVHKTIDDMINLYEPAILIVGTRGRSLGGFQGLLPGSVSKHCLQHSPVPVIVVRPNAKRAKKKRKRMEDPSRQAYRDILEKSGPGGGHLLDIVDPIDDGASIGTDAEAAAVAEAIGYRPHRLGLSTSGLSTGDMSEPTSAIESEATSPEAIRSPGVVMKSPELVDIDSPPLSASASDESNDEDEGGYGGVEVAPNTAETETLASAPVPDSELEMNADPEAASPASQNENRTVNGSEGEKKQAVG